MTALQKDSIYCIILSLISFVLFFFLLIITGNKIEVACSAFAVFGLYGLGPIIFYKKSNKILVDERDLEISRKAGSFAFGMFWVVFVLVTTIITFIKGFESSIPVSFLFLFVWAGAIAISLGRAIIILMMYRKGIAQ